MDLLIGILLSFVTDICSIYLTEFMIRYLILVKITGGFYNIQYVACSYLYKACEQRG